MNNFQKVVQLNEAFGNNSVGWDWDSVGDQFDLIKEEYEELIEAIGLKDKLDLVDACGDMLVVVYGLLHRVGVDANDVMERISKANFSKLIKDEEEAKATLAHYQNLGVSVELAGNYPKAFVRVAKGGKDSNGKYYSEGKFLKNINWQEPNYEGLKGV